MNCTRSRTRSRVTTHQCPNHERMRLPFFGSRRSRQKKEFNGHNGEFGGTITHRSRGSIAGAVKPVAAPRTHHICRWHHPVDILAAAAQQPLSPILTGPLGMAIGREGK